MARIELDYVHVKKDISFTKYRYPVVGDVTEYNNVTIRNRVIVKFDLLAGMTKAFERKTLQENREAVFNIIAGVGLSAKLLSFGLTYLYTHDRQFHNFVSRVYLFENEAEKYALADSICQHIREYYTAVYDMLTIRLREQRCKTILESSAYIYVAVPDENILLQIPGNYSEEVLSNAKVWDCKCQRVRAELQYHMV